MADLPLDWPHGYVTRDGERVALIGRRANGNIVWERQNGEFYRTDVYGNVPTEAGDDSPLDVHRAVAPFETVSVHLNFYRVRGEIVASCWPSRAAADDRRQADRLACIPIEFTVGQGLEKSNG